MAPRGKLLVGSGEREREEVLESIRASGGTRTLSLKGSAVTNYGGDKPHNNVQPTIIKNKIIRVL